MLQFKTSGLVSDGKLNILGTNIKSKNFPAVIKKHREKQKKKM